MMHNFILSQRPAENIFHDKSVGSHCLTVNGYSSVPVLDAALAVSRSYLVERISVYPESEIVLIAIPLFHSITSAVSDSAQNTFPLSVERTSTYWIAVMFQPHTVFRTVKMELNRFFARFSCAERHNLTMVAQKLS